MPPYQRDQSNLPHPRHHSYSLHRARADIKRMANRCGRLHCEAIRYPVTNFTMQQPDKKPDESKRTINRSFLHHNAYSPAIGQRHSVSRLHQQSDRSNTQTFGKFRSLCPTSGSRIRYIPYTAVHQVQKATGQTPLEFILDIRIQEAARLLDTHPEYNVNEIGDRTGFTSPKLFRQHFKERFQMTPTEYRRRKRP